MIRKILAVVAGVVVAFATVMLGELIAHQLFPINMPKTTDNAALAAAMAAAPLGAKLSLVLIYFLAPLFGAWVAGRVSRAASWPSWTVVALFLLATAANFFMLPHPLWLVVASVAAILVGGGLGVRLGARP